MQRFGKWHVLISSSRKQGLQQSNWLRPRHVKKNKKRGSASVPPLRLPPRRRTGQNINITKSNYKIPGIYKGHIYFFSTETIYRIWAFSWLHSTERTWGCFVLGFFFKAVPYPNPPSWGIKAFEATRVLRPPPQSKGNQMCEQKAVWDLYVNRKVYCQEADVVPQLRLCVWIRAEVRAEQIKYCHQTLKDGKILLYFISQ